MRLVLGLDPSSVEFGEKNSGGPYPYLLTVGDLVIAARAGTASGIAGTESSSLTVTLDNRGRRAAGIIGRPLRASADVYDDTDELLFSGIVASIEYGRVLTLEIGA